MAWVTAGWKAHSKKSMKIKFSIRSKLLLISAVLFVVPWIGVQYIQDMENFLRKNQQENLLGRAQIVAAVLQGQAGVFNAGEQLEKNNSLLKTQMESVDNPQLNQSSHIYVRPLKRAIQLDGYMDDWLDFEEKAKTLISKDIPEFQYQYYLASYKQYLYLLLKVKDESVVYRQANSLSLHKNDHLIIRLRNKQNELKTYFIATHSPGWVNAHRMEFRNDEWQSVAPELRIKGEWQQTREGYNVEIRLPLSLVGNGFSFYVANEDDKNSREIKTVLGEGDISGELGSIIIPSIHVENMLRRIKRPASRTWVIDRKYRVLAVAGDLRSASNARSASDVYSTSGEAEHDINKASVLSSLVSVFYNLLLTQPANNFKDELLSASYLRARVVQSALLGEPATSWRDTPDKRVRILTASYPVVINGKSVGAIAIEETSNAILILQNRAMKILINLSVLTFLITVVVLLSYATRLSVRIRKLRDETEQAISHEGRINNNFKPTNSGDEIGDLSRSFSDMLARLQEYNRYLETMAGKLSHELRTPITVVRSSLENLQMATNDEARETYVQRASEGMARLSDILTRMSEATRLEQTLQSETLTQVDLIKLIESCVAGYRLAYAPVIFNFENNVKNTALISGVADLLAQMLDKLIANAVDFHVESTPIMIELSEHKNTLQLKIINQGEVLPAAMRDNLFESMVSVRDKRGSQPHLGLGLYIVRMIAEFHQARVWANNLPDEVGVEIVLEFSCD